jgi:two-component sensor histidine kinase
MALIHEKLYQSKDLAKIEFSDYIRKLTTGIFHSYGVDPGSIKLEIDVEKIFLDVNTAIPCGLIINELVSNSLKHAFINSKGSKKKQGHEGRIHIKMNLDKNNKLTLLISDNGIGFPQDLDFRNMDSLGLQVVNTLVEQLEGKIELNRLNGTSFTITSSPLQK